MRLSRLGTLMLLITGILSLSSMSMAVEPKPVKPFYNHFTDQDELKIGDAFAQKIAKEGVPVVDSNGKQATAHIENNVLLEAYLNSIAAKLGAASQRPTLTYTVQVLDAPDTVNAMSIPGGHIYVYSGLLKFLQTEGELAAVLAHEIGHVVGRHAMNHIARIDVVAGLISQAREANIIQSDQAAQQIAQTALPILFSVDQRTFYSRNDEIEADMLGFYEMERAQWDPRSEVSLLEDLAKISPKEGTIASIISTHPDVSERLAIVRRETHTTRIPAGLTEDSLAFKTMKLGLSIGG